MIDAPLFRVTLPPGKRTGLDLPSQVMADEMVSVPRSALSRVVGCCDGEELRAVAEALSRWLDL